MNNNPMMGQMNMNNMDLISMMLQMCNMNQMMLNQMMQNNPNFQNFQNNPNFQDMQYNQNMQNCSNIGGNFEIRNAVDTGYDPFQNITQNKMNVYFEKMNGEKIMMRAPINITVSELIEGFFQKVGILNPNLKIQVNFLFNGKSLTKGQMDKKISDAGCVDGSKILVIDVKGILGA